MKQLLLATVAAASIAAAYAGSANATVITFDASGTGTDGPLSASATITTSAGQILVSLSNTLTSPFRSPGQAVSDISFTLGGAPGAVSLLTQAGSLVNACGTNNCSTVTPIAGSPTHYGVGASGNTITLETAGGVAQPGRPINMILSTGNYNFNMGVDNFDPYILGTGTFTIAASGVTSATTISSAMFSFGTGPDTFLPGTPTPPPTVPEPASMALLGTGLLGLGMVARRRKGA